MKKLSAYNNHYFKNIFKQNLYKKDCLYQTVQWRRSRRKTGRGHQTYTTDQILFMARPRQPNLPHFNVYDDTGLKAHSSDIIHVTLPNLGLDCSRHQKKTSQQDNWQILQWSTGKIDTEGHQLM